MSFAYTAKKYLQISREFTLSGHRKHSNVETNAMFPVHLMLTSRIWHQIYSHYNHII